MEAFFRSDLALENEENAGGTPKGCEKSERRVGRFLLSELRVRTEDAARALHQAEGSYLSVHCGRMTGLGTEEKELLARLLAGEIAGMAERLTGRCIDGDFSVLIVGLGNRALTADAIGPWAVHRLTATRHLRSYEEALYRSLGCASVSLLSPGVMGETGIESLAQLCAAVGTVEPHLVVVLDALAAADCGRLAATVQLSDAGISPGAGVGNCRERIDAATVGVPVISLGVPTVVDSSTLVWDALDKAGIKEVSPTMEEVLNNGRSFFVSPKDSDKISETAAEILAAALSYAFLGELAGEGV